MNIAIVDVGTNINPQENVNIAKDILSKEHQLLEASSVVRTKPIGNTHQPDFLNCALKIATELNREEFCQALKSIETTMGRVKSEDKFGPRLIDLDLLVWNKKVVHQDYYDRGFVQKYVSEIEQDLQH
ncbi:MAG: 2-amino-4-hydroxy-6-hydroxymethyldihydropteridine diphosphokinase [SAR324 cluster bacterium]|uniref:2-amino-4-hydroxy-6-hydroxymethyldihydropteridine diphosphokinase n=1 Tax=SAR324 cluster bacterium TaxID=2024889 RepID=A0A2A4T6T6_9DELT|nr:MAG: 2-amino-4-hydroxy-6-hydroxymethyldihydropteridine diphosphokinase [SAR324 cluster bacterium]